MARTFFEHVMNARIETLGEAHPDTRDAMYNLGSTLRDLNEPATAASIFARVYLADAAALGAEHKDTLRSLEQFAMAKFDAADYEPAATLWGELAGIRERLIGPADVATLNALGTQAEAFHRAGDQANERGVRERLVEITREAFGILHPATGQSIVKLAKLLQQMGDAGAAAKLIEEFTTAAI